MHGIHTYYEYAGEHDKKIKATPRSCKGHNNNQQQQWGGISGRVITMLCFLVYPPPSLPALSTLSGSRKWWWGIRLLVFVRPAHGIGFVRIPRAAPSSVRCRADMQRNKAKLDLPPVLPLVHRLSLDSRCLCVFFLLSRYRQVSLCAKNGTGPITVPEIDLEDGWGIEQFPCSRLSPLDCFQEGNYDCELLVLGQGVIYSINRWKPFMAFFCWPRWVNTVLAENLVGLVFL